MTRVKQTIEAGAIPQSLPFAAGGSRAGNRPGAWVGHVLRGCLFFSLLSSGFVAAAADPDEGTAIEYKVKAGFLLNFVKFAQWPDNTFPSTNSPIVIGLFETDPEGPVLERALQQKTASGHPLQVRRFHANELLTNCHLFFLSRAEKAQTSRLLDRLKGMPVLTVGESEGFASAGGMINFVMKGENIRFEINLAAVERAGLQISSKLANMATLVKPAN